MEKELIKFIQENNIEIFTKLDSIKRESKSIFKTKDARAIFTRTIGKIAENFSLNNTKNILSFFDFTSDNSEIKKRQNFFRGIGKLGENSFLKKLTQPEPRWSPKYDITLVTGNEKTFIQLKNLGCPVKFINSEDDVKYLENSDIIQVIDAEELQVYLEQLAQTVFLKNIDEAYLERYLELLSGWKNNLAILGMSKDKLNPEINSLVESLIKLLELTDEKKNEKLTKEIIEEKLESINERVSEKIKTLNFSGEILMKILSENSLPKELARVIDEEIEKSKVPEEIFLRAIPLKIDERELDKFLREQDSNEFVGIADRIKIFSKELKTIPAKLEQLESLLVLFDFYTGISRFTKENQDFPEITNDFEIKNSRNIFLESAQPISFRLDSVSRCSILTGANSGGKTTLLEHIIQIITLTQIGLPINEKVSIPLFSDVYYFAKNKGSISKGAFETLLTQMSEIKPGPSTIILADEIESVTEPGVAGKILCATADYFIQKNCFVIIATHLGREVQMSLPLGARIDGIEAKGLDENNELIVDHNPVLGKLANSTPELIVEKMANQQDNDYIRFIFKSLKKN